MAGDIQPTQASGEVQKTLPVPRFVAIRGGKTEAMNGVTSREEALAALQRQVRTSGAAGGSLKVAYLFELVAAEVYVPHSVTVSPENIEEELKRQQINLESL